jgi:hypothetical protein
VPSTPEDRKTSRDLAFEAKKNRILHLYGLMDGTTDVQPGDAAVVICMDEFGPSTSSPTPVRGFSPPPPGQTSTATSTTSTPLLTSVNIRRILDQR